MTLQSITAEFNFVQEELFFEENTETLKSVLDAAESAFEKMQMLTLDKRIEALNRMRLMLHESSPFSHEPVDCVVWVKASQVTANDYNPNSVAPPEMRLLEHSIQEDGYTQPIVAWKRDGAYEVVDGFHRHRVGKESAAVSKRIHGYLPLSVINDDRKGRSDRIAATIRHNRARGKHRVDAMSDIVVELKRRNWSDEKIGKELGMDPDEVLRLCQITGLAEAFKDESFSEAWETNKESDVFGQEIFSDVIDGFEANDKGRIFHSWDKWECYKAGFYAERPEGITQDEGEELYRKFLADTDSFESSLKHIIEHWTYSCEHYLTNDRMNRIAWLGQASVAHAMGIPSCCRGGYHRLSDEQKKAADELALKYLNLWLSAHGKDPVSMEQAGGRTEAELY